MCQIRHSGGMNYVRDALAVGVCLMFLALRAAPAHNALLVSYGFVQAGAAFLLLAVDPELAVPAETDVGKVQSRAGKKASFFNPKNMNKLIMLEL